MTRFLGKNFRPRDRPLRTALGWNCEAKQNILMQHHQSMVESLEASKGRRGANLERIADKIQGTMLDQKRRLEDLERKNRLGIEVALVHMAVVSYPKLVVPVRLQQGRDERLGVAVWDPLVHQGYFHALSTQPG